MRCPVPHVRTSVVGFIIVAGGRGFEPRLTESESAVLPLNYPPTRAARVGPGGWAAYVASRIDTPARRNQHHPATRHAEAIQRSRADPRQECSDVATFPELVGDEWQHDPSSDLTEHAKATSVAVVQQPTAGLAGGVHGVLAKYDACLGVQQQPLAA